MPEVDARGTPQVQCADERIIAKEPASIQTPFSELSFRYEAFKRSIEALVELSEIDFSSSDSRKPDQIARSLLVLKEHFETLKESLISADRTQATLKIMDLHAFMHAAASKFFFLEAKAENFHTNPQQRTFNEERRKIISDCEVTLSREPCVSILQDCLAEPGFLLKLQPVTGSRFLWESLESCYKAPLAEKLTERQLTVFKNLVLRLHELPEEELVNQLCDSVLICTGTRGRRIASLWSREDLGAVTEGILKKLEERVKAAFIPDSEDLKEAGANLKSIAILSRIYNTRMLPLIIEGLRECSTFAVVACLMPEAQAFRDCFDEALYSALFKALERLFQNNRPKIEEPIKSDRIDTLENQIDIEEAALQFALYDMAIHDFHCVRSKSTPVTWIPYAFTLEGNRHVLRCFLRKVNDKTLSAWIDAMLDFESKVGRAAGAPMESLTRLKVGPEAIKRFFQFEGSYHDLGLAAEALSEKFLTEEAAHIIMTSGGALRKIISLGSLCEGRIPNKENVVSKQEILNSKDLDSLIDLIRPRFQELVDRSFEEGEKALRQIAATLDRTSLTEEEYQHVQGCVSNFRERVEHALDMVFHKGAGLTLSYLEGVFQNPKFMKMASGLLDSKMMLVPTWPQDVLLTDLGSKLSEIFPEGIQKADINKKNKDVPQKYSRVNRGRLKKILLQEIKDLALSAGVEMTEDFIEKTLQARPFQERVLLPALRFEGVKAEHVAIRIAPKSDPQAWTSGNQVVCCATCDAENQTDFLNRGDAAHLLVEREGAVVAMAVLWYGEDDKTLVINNIEIAPNQSHEKDRYRDIIRQYIANYCTGNVQYVFKSKKIEPRFSRAHIGSKTGDVDLSSFALSVVVRPKGDLPENVGKWNDGHSDADTSQKLFWGVET